MSASRPSKPSTKRATIGRFELADGEVRIVEVGAIDVLQLNFHIHLLIAIGIDLKDFGLAVEAAGRPAATGKTLRFVADE